jgi:hypothetical protein
VNLPVKNKRISDISVKQDTLLVITRDYLLKTTDLKYFQVIQLPEPENYKKETSMFRMLWTLHSGELFGLGGKLFVDLLGIVICFLSVTGIIHFVFPSVINRIKNRKEDLLKIKRNNLQWHNAIGYVFVFFLIVNSIAGMFLRPPLLIPIVNFKTPVIPYSHLDGSNPWRDKLRRIQWDGDLHRYIFSTSEGFYYCDESFAAPMVPFEVQPPVSVMGCNVLQRVAPTTYLIGSFSGLFSWDLRTGYVYNVIENKVYKPSNVKSKPISGNMISGLIYLNNREIWYTEYNRGVEDVFQQNRHILMPCNIIEASQISLWNLSLEIHTGRVFEFLFGPFYILFIPLAGICILVVLVSGFFLWYWVYRNKRTNKVKR